MTQSNYIRKPVSFSDGPSISLEILSSWNRRSSNDSGDIKAKEISTQTDNRLYEFNDIDIQTGKGTVHLQGEVSARDAGQSFVNALSTLTKYTTTELAKYIEEGYARIDDEIRKDPNIFVKQDAFIELLLSSHEISTQTDPSQTEKTIESMSVREEKQLDVFLRKACPSIEDELDMNIRSKAFDNYTFTAIDSAGPGGSSAGEDVRYWKTLQVDLEKKKVTYPDWSTAKHARGRIAKALLTRTKERVYDVDYDDGSRLKGVKEEHIRVLEDSKLISDRKSRGRLPATRLLEGVRVHTRVTYKSGDVKYLPGRIMTASKGGTFDIEIDGGRVLRGVTADDLMIGIEEGQGVEALKPNKIELQAMDTCWNSTGSSIATCYGRQDITGWCNYPGAVVIWNVFSASGNNANANPNEPDFVLDHSTCITACKYHPEYPSILAAGSFNGEVLVYDLNTPEEAVAVSPITEYTHKEPVLDMLWMYDNSSKIWLLVTVGADGRVLFWDYMSNSLAYPVKGALLSCNTKGSSRSMRQYPRTHGGTAIAVTGSSISGHQGSSHNNMNQWSVIGQEGGTIIRSPLNRFFESGSNYLTKESFKSLPNYEELFMSVKRVGDTFSHEPHVGTVNALHCSSLYRNIFLSGGADGSVKLFHMLEKTPLKLWDPIPNVGTSGVSGTFAPITDVKFSPIRACVFAVSSADGFLYIYDLSESMSSPVAVLEAIAPSTEATETVRLKASKGKRRVGISSISFNHRQRDLIAASDLSGKIHVWRLNWKLANRQANDVRTMDAIARFQTNV